MAYLSNSTTFSTVAFSTSLGEGQDTPFQPDKCHNSCIYFIISVALMTRGGKTTITMIERIIKIRLKLKEKPNEIYRIITYVVLLQAMNTLIAKR